MSLDINDDAIFIADSHIQKNRDALIHKLNYLHTTRQKNPSQIILLGDISNLLVGGIESSHKINKGLIECLKHLPSQIIYFEGNHDFNIGCILDSIITIPRVSQPIIARYKDKTVLLAHGDIFLNKKYEWYIKTITSKAIISLLGYVDSITRGKIFDIINDKIKAKAIRYPKDIESIVNSRIQSYKRYIKSLDKRIDMVIEGHFHLGRILHTKDFTYIAMPSFYHEAKIFDIQEERFEIL